MQESRDKAMLALEKIAAIRDQINEAAVKTSDAENALQGALNDAIEARDVALEAQKIAEKVNPVHYANQPLIVAPQASRDADKIREEAEATKALASRLKTEADVLTGNVEETGARMRSYEGETTCDVLAVI